MRRERGIRVVGQALLDAHLGIQQAVVAAAENVVGHFQRQIIRVAAAYAEFSHANLRLHRVRLVDKPDVAPRGNLANRWRRSRGRLNFLPSAKVFFRDSQGFFRRDVAGDAEQGLVRRVIRVVEFHAIFALNFLHRGGRAFGGQSVGRLAISYAAEYERGQIIRIAILHGEVRKQLLALPVELLGAESGVQYDVGHQIESRIQIFLHHIKRYRGGILAHRSGERAAHKINRFRNLARRTLLRSLRQELGRHLRHPRHSWRILDGPGGENHEPHRNRRLAIVAHDENAQAIRQSLGGRVGKVKGPRRCGSRHFRHEFHARRNDARPAFLLLLARRHLACARWGSGLRLLRHCR